MRGKENKTNQELVLERENMGAGETGAEDG